MHFNNVNVFHYFLLHLLPFRAYSEVVVNEILLLLMIVILLRFKLASCIYNHLELPILSLTICHRVIVYLSTTIKFRCCLWKGNFKMLIKTYYIYVLGLQCTY